jgi:hypothetical protein
VTSRSGFAMPNREEPYKSCSFHFKELHMSLHIG